MAVFQIQDKGVGLSDRSLDSLTEYLAAALAEGGVYEIVPPSDLRKLLVDRKRESYKSCYDQRCQIELGREAAANKSLSTTSLRIGSTCVLTGAMYDLKRQTTDFTAKIKGECSETGLMQSIDLLVTRFRAWELKRTQKQTDARQPVEAVGFLTVRSTPRGAKLQVDGEPVGATPLERLELPTGDHSVNLSVACHNPAERQAEVRPGQETALSVELEPATAQLRVEVRDQDGEDLRAQVWVGDAQLGPSPGPFQVSACARAVRVIHPRAGEKEQALDLKAGQEQRIAFALELPKAAPVASAPQDPVPSQNETPSRDEAITQVVANADEPPSPPPSGGAWYEQWWVWTAVGVVVVGATAGGLAGAGVFDGESRFRYVELNW